MLLYNVHFLGVRDSGLFGVALNAFSFLGQMTLKIIPAACIRSQMILIQVEFGLIDT